MVHFSKMTAKVGNVSFPNGVFSKFVEILNPSGTCKPVGTKSGVTHSLTLPFVLCLLFFAFCPFTYLFRTSTRSLSGRLAMSQAVKNASCARFANAL